MTRRQRTSAQPIGKRLAWVVLGSVTIHVLILAPLAFGSLGVIPSRIVGTQPRWQQPIELVLIPGPRRLAPDQAETESGVPVQVQGTEGGPSDMVSPPPLATLRQSMTLRGHQTSKQVVYPRPPLQEAPRFSVRLIDQRGGVLEPPL